MGIIALVFYFFSLATSVAMIVFSHRLLKQYAYKFLNFYFYYVIFFYVFGFLNFTSRLILAQIFAPGPSTVNATSQVIGVTALPVFLISLFFAMSWIRDLVGKRIPIRLKMIYWTSQAVLLTAFLYGVATLAKTNDFSLAGPIFEVVTTIELLIILIILLQVYFYARAIEDTNRKQLAMNLGHMYIVGFFLMTIFGKFIRIPYYIYPAELSFQIVVTFLFFFINIPPLFYLYVFLNKHHGEWGAHVPEPARLRDWYTRYDITAREEEIIDLIMEGKTNEEIGDELFISTKTVKNNISSIYKKLGAKNRVQLTNMIRGE
ncbi:MAG TPA: helix-turn-helix transcriptional regulator [Candidatus Kapabacteria bacterium]|nr:helix-turn-helix transcriptional regulator [Candidatus Kapabacteria bacterium]